MNETPKVGDTYSCSECGLKVQIVVKPCEDTGMTRLYCCGQAMAKEEQS